MKLKVLIIVLSIIWIGSQAQTVDIDIRETAGNCVLSSNCEDNTVCYDLIIEIAEPGWELRSYNIWVNYAPPPELSYNSDNACLIENGGDTDNNQNGHYRVGGINGSVQIQPGIPTTIHTICFEYDNGNMLTDSEVIAGGTTLVYGFPFESTLTLTNTVSGETAGISITSMDSVSVELTNDQIVEVSDGWSGISSWLQPLDPDIEDIMSPAINNLVVMYNLTDGIYSPENNINTINNWNYKSGYIIKVTDEVMVNFCASEAESKSINLMAGWNIIPVLNNSEVPVELVFDELGENLVIVKEIAGYQMYYPAFSINSLSSLKPGKAYLIKVLESCMITFPELIASKAESNQAFYFELISPWNKIHKTPASHVFCFGDEVSAKFETGDLVGSFDQAGICTGIMEILDPANAFAVSVFGNDQTTEIKDGMGENEETSFRLYKPATGEQYNMELQFADNTTSGGNFESNGISIVKNIVVNTTGTGINNVQAGVNLSIYPNPTLGLVNCELTGGVPIDGQVIITDSRGQFLFDSEFVSNGDISRFKFDLSTNPRGVYYLRVISKNYLNIKKIIVN